MNSLGKIDLQPPEDIETGTRQLDVQQDAIRSIYNAGLHLPVAPQGYSGEMPLTLTDLDDAHLGDLLNKLSTWTGFVDAELAKSDAARNEAKARLEFVRARVRIMVKQYEEKKLTNPDKDDLVNTDPRVVTATGRYLYCEAIYTMTRAVRENAQRKWETVSRRITQRGQEIERMRRDTNIGNAPINSRTFRR